MTSVGELLFLRAAERLAKRTPEDQRRALEAALALSAQRAGAAEVLWSNGHLAEGLRLMALAFEEAHDAVSVIAGDTEASGDEDASGDGSAERLRAAGLSAEEADAAAGVDRRLRETVLPRLDAQLTPPETELYGRLARARRAIARRLAPAARTPSGVAWTRRLRLLGVAAAAAALGMGAYVALRVPVGVHATASDTWSPQHGLAEAAVDGDPETEWMLPDGETGWLDVTINPPTRIETLRLLNGHNGGYHDRAVRSAVIELHSGGRVARRLTHEWPDLVPRPPWVELEAGVDEVERVRVFVRGFHREGAALAEIDWR